MLIQHSAGSGKSNSIAWLSHQLMRLVNTTRQVVDSVIVITDRRILDQQIRDTIKQFAQVGATAWRKPRLNQGRSFYFRGDEKNSRSLGDE